MIGNDIIDIAYTRKSTNWQRPRFLAKVFNTEEQEYINKANDPFLMIWQLWSMKEAAYKAYVRQGGSAFNDPKRIDIALDSQKSGEARIDSFRCSLMSNNTAHYIVSHTRKNSKHRLINKVFKVDSKAPANPSTQVYKKLFTCIAIDRRLNEQALSLKKEVNRVPQLYYQDKKLNIDFSLSHHGEFAAISFLSCP